MTAAKDLMRQGIDAIGESETLDLAARRMCPKRGRSHFPIDTTRDPFAVENVAW